MPGFLIPLAGLALGALGRLINTRRSAAALSNASGMAVASTPSETGLSTAATSPTAAEGAKETGTPGGMRAGAGTEGQAPGTAKTGGRTQAGVEARRSAANERVNNQGGTSAPSLPPSLSPPGEGGGGGPSAAQIGEEAVRRSRLRNRQQQGRISNAALS